MPPRESGLGMLTSHSPFKTSLSVSWLPPRVSHLQISLLSHQATSSDSGELVRVSAHICEGWCPPPCSPSRPSLRDSCYDYRFVPFSSASRRSKLRSSLQFVRQHLREDTSPRNLVFNGLFTLPAALRSALVNIGRGEKIRKV